MPLPGMDAGPGFLAESLRDTPSLPMRRADRLFHIVQLIRGRRLTTASFLAQRLEVSERTVYRDVADLQRQGVPIDGEAGVGYRLGAGFDLPPLMFTHEEAQALVAAARIAQPSLDPALAAAVDAALGKILSVLPTGARAAAEGLALFAPGQRPPAAVLQQLQLLREAVRDRVRLQLSYRDEAGRASERTVRPLGCFFWGQVWTLAGWCEVREDFRTFRVDRIVSAAHCAQGFRDEPGKTLADLFRRTEAEMRAASCRP